MVGHSYADIQYLVIRQFIHGNEAGISFGA